MIEAGRSDKYGQVHVERIGNTGFDDPTEPIALFRAQDKLALKSLRDYLRRCIGDPDVPAAQITSVCAQVEAFERYQREHPDRVRKPGTVVA